MSDSIISIKNVTNRFGKQTVHDEVNLEVRRGEILGIAGGSGSGKSVLMKTMSGLHTPTSGEVTLNGKAIAEISPKESAYLLGVLFQEGALFSALTVAENIALPLREHTTLSEEARNALVRLKLALVGLPPETALKYPSELSGGMTKRAAMARAVAMDPLILFLDEPTAGLDPINAAAFDELIFKLSRGLSITVVMVTHDLDTLFGICDRVAVVVDKNVVVDTVPRLLENEHPWIQEFFHNKRARGAKAAARSQHGK